MTPIADEIDMAALGTQLESLVRGAEEFKAEHGSCRVTVGPNAPVAKAKIQRVAGFWIDVDHVTLVSTKGDGDDLVIDGPLVYFRAVEQDGLSAKDVVRAVDWLGAMQEIEFSSANYESVDEDGEIYLEGRMGKALVDATFVLKNFSSEPDWDDGWDDGWDAEDDE